MNPLVSAIKNADVDQVVGIICLLFLAGLSLTGVIPGLV